MWCCWQEDLLNYMCNYIDNVGNVSNLGEGARQEQFFHSKGLHFCDACHHDGICLRAGAYSNHLICYISFTQVPTHDGRRTPRSKKRRKMKLRTCGRQISLLQFFRQVLWVFVVYKIHIYIYIYISRFICAYMRVCRDLLVCFWVCML